ncbi:hypothetical protein J7T55_006181 [Diaporthe amygdali]|uniref:uncharacterized protein n=1 Tax=Phomopsis amygdali TaxID=1214568 RepID=UPI0022FE7DDB|nr:uncharacterized protein J7T55_006181 [Diaporthe amygdali]KAJ0124838.1 hypothetical protein J7T55_006181 [Diaporthe amygdali]
MPVKLVFGAGGIGWTEKSFTYTWDTEEKVTSLLDTLETLGLNELDSAASYPPGNPWNTETLLGQSKVVERGFVVDSKILGARGPMLTDERISASVEKTLQLLGAKKVRTMYAHFFDEHTPIAETAKAFDRQYREGKFERLGLCSYPPAKLSEYFSVCEASGYIKPTVYQGEYNALARDDEADLIPLLRQHNCAYYAYSPLAGGFLTGKVTFAVNAESELHRTRFHGASAFKAYVDKYDNQKMHDAIKQLKKVCDEEGVSLQEASLRWLVWQSKLGEGDAVILGATKEGQLESNVKDARKGPLGQRVKEAVEELLKDHGKL